MRGPYTSIQIMFCEDCAIYSETTAIARDSIPDQTNGTGQVLTMDGSSVV